jgi:hypothetical protein
MAHGQKSQAGRNISFRPIIYQLAALMRFNGVGDEESAYNVLWHTMSI